MAQLIDERGDVRCMNRASPFVILRRKRINAHHEVHGVRAQHAALTPDTTFAP